MNVKELSLIIKNSDNIVFFGGAGVSTESGIPDFRSADGIYMMNCKYPPESIISHSFFMTHTEEFFDFYKEHLIYPNAKPNAAHMKLAELERSGKNITIVTQNIDGLHTTAGSKKIYELHGCVDRNFCIKCGKFYDRNFISESVGIPRCDCGGIVKPDVVLYEESLNDDTVVGAVNAIERADTLIVAGTSLRVYPASGFLKYFNGENLILINRDKTAMDEIFTNVINDSVGKIMSEINI